MHKRNVLNSPRLLELRNRKKKIFIRKIIVFSVLFLIFVGALSYISRIKRFNIAEVQVEGNKVIDTMAVIEVVNREIAGKYLWLFPKTNILLYPKSKISAKIADKFKRFKDITLSVGTGKNLVISVSERAPEYTWCGTIPPQTTEKETCYFLDKDGYIFDEAPYFSGEVYFKFYGKANVGTYFSKENQENFAQLILFKDALVAMELKPVVLYIEDTEDIKIFLSRGPQILFKKDADLGRVAENLKAAISTEPLKSKLKNNYSALQYIDLRFGNKVYYKFRP